MTAGIAASTNILDLQRINLQRRLKKWQEGTEKVYSVLLEGPRFFPTLLVNACTEVRSIFIGDHVYCFQRTF